MAADKSAPAGDQRAARMRVAGGRAGQLLDDVGGSLGTAGLAKA